MHPNNESSFNIKSLNLKNLEIQNFSSKKRQNRAHDLLPEGDYVSLNLLFIQAYLYTFNHYLIVPSIFMFANDLGYSPAYAGLLLAMTPFSTSFYAIVTNYWTRASFKYPLLLGIVSIIASNVLYIHAYQESSMFYLLLSRLLFGIGGSKVIHRKYIANFVQRARWTKYYQRLIFSSFLGMIMGPLVYLLMISANRNLLLVPNTYLLAAYFGLGLFGLLFVVLLCFFGSSSYSQREQN